MNEIPDTLFSLISQTTDHTVCQRDTQYDMIRTPEPLSGGALLSCQTPDHMSAVCQQYIQYDRIRTPEPLSEVAFTVQSNSMTTRQLEVFFASIT
jgi:hypothetical protein